MKHTRHQYHYAVRCCKRNKLNNQKPKVADNVSNSTEFWKEVNKLDTANKMITLTMDDVNGKNNITELLLLNKYKTLYNSVPTSDAELSSIKDIVNEGIINHQLQGILITPYIISDCVKQLNKAKDDGNHGFKSDH